MNRRRFLQSAALAGAAPAPGAPPDWDRVREDFPWIKRQLWISAADYHPLCVQSVRAVEKYYAWRSIGPGEDRTRFTGEQQTETKRLFAQLIGAKTTEIAWAASTTDAENIAVSGLRFPRGSNVVVDSLHYQASKFLYHMLEKEGLIQLRVVHHRADPYWRIDPKDMEKAIDRNTRLVSLALVSNINGYLHDARKTAEIAHAHGAIVYADIIQAAGAIPIDVHALGIDCAGCGCYKWLMGDQGIAFLYIKEDLQGTKIRRTRYGVRQYRSPNAAQADSQFDLLPGAAQYEVSGTIANAAGVVVHASLQYIHRLGIANIRAHAKALTDKLQREMPRLGYPPISPPDNPTPVVSFLTPDPKKTAAKLDKAFGEYVVAQRRWEFTDDSGKVNLIQGIRVSPSVYNNESDVDRLLGALS